MLNNINTITVANTSDFSDLTCKLTLNNGQAALIICDNGNVSIYTLAPNDPKIADLSKTKVADRTY